jgi:pentatricopeptide repeat protein
MLKNCGSIKCKDNEIRSQRDFIFIAVWLIEHYLELGNIEKARAIYESIKSCGSICNDLLKNKNNCGCNG